jgi:hypothetical protein
MAAALVAVGVLLAAPSAALACSGGPSAVNVYKECLTTGGGQKPASGGGQQVGTPTQPTTPVSSQTAHALKGAGKDSRVLSALVRGYGPRPLPSSATGSESSPSALGSAFDLGSGPTVLLIALAGTALLLLGGSGMRVWRNRHRA